MRIRLSLRMIALAATVLICVIFSIITLAGVNRMGGMITGVVFSSLALCGLMVANVLSAYESIRTLFAAPAGYGLALAPVPSWKILLGRLVPIVVWDLVTYAIGITCVTIQSLMLAGLTQSDVTPHTGDLGFIAWGVLIIALHYILLFLAIFFACAVTKSLFFRTRARGLLGFLFACVVLYVLSLADLLIAPFASVVRWGSLFMINVTMGVNAGMFVAMTLLLAKIVLLFCGTAYLMERKVNL